MNGIEGIIFSPLYDKIPNEVWSALLNAVVENMFRRRKSKLYSEMGDGVTRQVLTGSASNFQKLTWFASQVTTLFGKKLFYPSIEIALC